MTTDANLPNLPATPKTPAHLLPLDQEWIDREISYVTKRLGEEMQSLAERLLRAKKQLEESTAADTERRGIFYGTNSLGEVQGMGASIDVLCGKVATLLECRRMMQRSARKAQDEKEVRS